jgi:hypothetical protein
MNSLKLFLCLGYQAIINLLLYQQRFNNCAVTIGTLQQLLYKISYTEENVIKERNRFLKKYADS